jgi:hypothetical protein
MRRARPVALGWKDERPGREGLPLLDLFAAFAAREDWPLLFVAGDVHFSAEGNRLAGEALAETLASLAAGTSKVRGAPPC